MAGGSLGPLSRLIYYFQYHPRSACSRRIQETLKGCKGESESPREKEIKRKRERGTGAVDSSNLHWQDSFSKDMSLFKVDSTQMGQSSTLVPESSLLPGLTPKNVSISIPAPSWKTGLKALVWYLYPHQWHGVEIRLKDIP